MWKLYHHLHSFTITIINHPQHGARWWHHATVAQQRAVALVEAHRALDVLVAIAQAQLELGEVTIQTAPEEAVAWDSVGWSRLNWLVGATYLVNGDEWWLMVVNGD